MSFAIRREQKRLRRKWLEQLDEEMKEARNQDLLKVVDAAAKRAGERLVGREVEILCEGPSKTNHLRLTGRTRSNKIVVFEGDESDIGQLIDLKITHSTGFSLSAVRAEAGEQLSFVADGRTSAARYDRFMIYSLSLHSAGLIAGALLILLSLAAVVLPARNLLPQFPRSRIAGAALLTVDLVWSFWLLATMEMGEFSSFRRPLLIIAADRIHSRAAICR